LSEGPTRGSESASQLVEKAQVDVDVTVIWTVERPDLGGRGAAPGVQRSAEESRPGGLVRLAGARERILPVRLHAVDVADYAAVFLLVRVGARLAFAGEGAARCRPVVSDGLVDQLIEGAGLACRRHRPGQQRIDDDDDRPEPATTDGNAAPADPASALVVDLSGVEARIGVEGHVPLLARYHPCVPQAACRGCPERYAVR